MARLRLCVNLRGLGPPSTQLACFYMLTKSSSSLIALCLLFSALCCLIFRSLLSITSMTGNSTMSIKGVEIAITSDAGTSLKSSNNHDVRAELNVVNANLAPDGTQRS